MRSRQRLGRRRVMDHRRGVGRRRAGLSRLPLVPFRAASGSVPSCVARLAPVIRLRSAPPSCLEAWRGRRGHPASSSRAASASSAPQSSAWVSMQLGVRGRAGCRSRAVRAPARGAPRAAAGLRLRRPRLQGVFGGRPRRRRGSAARARPVPAWSPRPGCHYRELRVPQYGGRAEELLDLSAVLPDESVHRTCGRGRSA
jgi:hypothetical protein